MKLSDEMQNYIFEGPWNYDGYLVPEDVDKKVEEWGIKVAELEAENERLGGLNAKDPENFFQRRFFNKGMERAAEIVENHEEPNLRGYVRDSLIQAIRAELEKSDE